MWRKLGHTGKMGYKCIKHALDEALEIAKEQGIG